MLRTILLALLLLPGCKAKDTKEAPTPSRPAGSVDPRDAAVAKAAAASDAALKNDPYLDKPMRFARKNRGKPPASTRCPDDHMCVTERDVAYFVTRNSWKHYYLLDRGAPSQGLRLGFPTGGQIDLRLEAALREIGKANGASELRVHCSIALPLRRLLGLERYVRKPVPPATAPITAAPEVMTPKAANSSVTAAYAKVDSDARSRPLFDKSQLSRMKIDALTEPRLSVVGRLLGTWRAMTDVRFVVLWSPASRRVYVLDRSTKGGKAHFTVAKIAARRKATEAATIAALQALQLKTVRVDAAQMCHFPTLTGTGTWLPARL